MGFLYSQLFVTPKHPDTSFEGQTVIVTGANTGLGKEAVRHIARLGASKVILACRNIKAAEEARQDILTSTKVDPSILEVWQLDLSSYESVKAFAERASKLPRLDVLLENAGIASSEFQLFESHESTITVNVISTFLLALLLLPKLKEVATKFNVQPRIAVISSEVHAWTKLEQRKQPVIFEALDKNVKGAMDDRYPVSKLLEVLVIREIASNIAKSGVIMSATNPGFCHSELVRNAGFPQNIVIPLMKFFLARTTEVGSRALVNAAAAGEESHGKYMHDSVVDEASLSAFVKSEEGAETGRRVWSELKDILEKIQPGVTNVLSA